MSSRLSSVVLVVVVVLVVGVNLPKCGCGCVFPRLSKLIVKVATCHCLRLLRAANFHVLQLATAPQLLDAAAAFCLCFFLAYFLAVYFSCFFCAF